MGEPLPVATPGAVAAGSLVPQTANPTDGGQNVHIAGGSVQTSPAPPVSPASYQAPSTSLTGQSGATWLSGTAYALPTGLKSVSFVINWTHGGPTSQLSYRIRLGHASGVMGVSRIRNASPVLAGAVATQAEYQSTITVAEVGADAVIPVVYENSDGFAYIALDVQQAVVDGGGDGTVGITLAGSYA